MKNELKMNEKITINVVGLERYEFVKNGKIEASGFMTEVKGKAGIRGCIGGRAYITTESYNKIIAFEKEYNKENLAKLIAELKKEEEEYKNSSEYKRLNSIKKWENEDYSL